MVQKVKCTHSAVDSNGGKKEAKQGRKIGNAGPGSWCGDFSSNDQGRGLWSKDLKEVALATPTVDAEHSRQKARRLQSTEMEMTLAY